MKKQLLLLLFETCLLVLAGCGGGSTPPPQATHFLITPASTTATAGTPFSITVTALDASGVLVPGYSGSVHFTSSNGQPVQPGSATLTSGTGTLSITLSTAGSQTITATDTSITGTSTSITVSAVAVATHFSISVPAAVMARQLFTFTVTALDANSNTVTSYSGTVRFTSSDPKFVPPSNSAITNGAGNFSVTLETPGSQTITVTDTVTASLSGNSSPIVAIAPATLAITSPALPNGTVDRVYGGTRTVFELCTQGKCSPCSRTPFPGTCGSYPPCPNGRICISVLNFTGFTLTATGGVPPYSWNASSLPPGLEVMSENGKEFDLTGTPPPGSTATYKNVLVTVSDSGTPQAQMPATYTIVISNPLPPVIDTVLAPPAGAVNLPYSFTFAASGGQQPLSWSETGALPTGLGPLSSAGVLSGAPTTAGPFPITVTAQDSLSQNSAPQNFTISIFPHGFKVTGSMDAARSGYTATLLANGKVLIAGGFVQGSGPLATAELYDPTTETFAATGSMGTPRVGHTATLLNDGTVLVAGGTDTNVDLATAELFDPNTGIFTPTKGSMATAREGHAAVLLNDNKVIVLGGGNSTGLFLQTAELYDPATGNFTATGSMGTARQSYSFTTTLLANGKVLVTGGFDASTLPLASAELYDPSAGTFAPTGSLMTARSQDTATLLNTGKVLIAGGMDTTATPVARGELYDPTAETFAFTGSMLTPRTQHSATLLNDGTVLLAGGYDHPVNQISDVSSAELFDPTSGTFAATGSMVYHRIADQATLLSDGRVLVTGGFSDEQFGYLATAELYQ